MLKKICPLLAERGNCKIKKEKPGLGSLQVGAVLRGGNLVAGVIFIVAEDANVFIVSSPGIPSAFCVVANVTMTRWRRSRSDNDGSAGSGCANTEAYRSAHYETRQEASSMVVSGLSFRRAEIRNWQQPADEQNHNNHQRPFLFHALFHDLLLSGAWNCSPVTIWSINFYPLAGYRTLQQCHKNV